MLPAASGFQKKLFIISGLGADERVFHRIDFSGYTPVFVNWEIPVDNETIEEYAERLTHQITEINPILIGLSFGGMMAIEIAKQINTEKVILISSVKTKYEIPFYFRLAGKTRLVNILPVRLLKYPNFVTNWYFGVSTKSDKMMLRQILIDTDPQFLKWAIDKIANWNNTATISNLFHIHGTNDRVLPYRFVNCDATIQRGEHLMILSRYDELTSILRQAIEK